MYIISLPVCFGAHPVGSLAFREVGKHDAGVLIEWVRERYPYHPSAKKTIRWTPAKLFFSSCSQRCLFTRTHFDAHKECERVNVGLAP